MAARDIAGNCLLQDKHRLADLVNTAVYGGRDVIGPDDIREVTPVIAKIWWEGNEQKTDVRTADVSFLIVRPGWRATVYIQNQTEISYIFPVRSMDSDSAAYFNQWRRIGMKHLKNRDLLPGGEFLSRFKRDDRLDAVFTIVLYYGRKKWDGARSLKGLLPDAVLADPILDYVADYPLNLLEVRSYPDYNRFRTDLRQIFGFLQRDHDTRLLKQYFADNQSVFDGLAGDAYDFLAAMSNIRFLQEHKNQYLNEGSGTYMMPKAFEDWAKTERAEGKAEGKAEGVMQARFSNAHNMYRRGYPAEEIAEIVGETKATILKWCGQFASM